MKTKKIKKNKACPAKLQQSRGFVILFAVVISSILLAIALGVSDIAFREVKFGTSAKDANDAFFAADTGVECALYYDRFDKNVFIELESEISIPMICAGLPIALIGTSSPWSFNVVKLGSNSRSCAKVTVSKNYESFPTLTTVISKGYNTGNNYCESPDSNRVERELEVIY